MAVQRRTANYRGRWIENDAAEENDEYGYAGVITGTSVVMGEHGPLTPRMPLSYAWVYDPDHDNTETHYGWILLGDFLFLATPDGVHLWADGADGALDSTLRLCDVEQESAHRSDRLRGFRFNDAKELRDGWWANLMYPDRAEAIGGAARVYAQQHGGWRWLFPHPDGPRAAFERLTSTSSSDDAAVLREILRAAPNDDDVMFAEEHFGQAWGASLELPRAASLHPLVAVVPAADEVPFSSGEFPKSRVLDGRYRRVTVAEALGAPPPEHGYAVCVRRDVADLRGLEAIPRIVSLDLRHRSNLRDLSAVAELSDLRELRIYGGAKELVDLSPIAALENLEVLELYNLPKVTALPKFSRLRRLHTLKLGLLDHVIDLDIGDLSSLRELSIYFCKKLRGKEVIDRLCQRHALTTVGVSCCPEIGDIRVEGKGPA
jgi:hypothetical protein